MGYVSAKIFFGFAFANGIWMAPFVKAPGPGPRRGTELGPSIAWIGLRNFLRSRSGPIMLIFRTCLKVNCLWKS